MAGKKKQKTVKPKPPEGPVIGEDEELFEGVVLKKDQADLWRNRRAEGYYGLRSEEGYTAYQADLQARATREAERDAELVRLQRLQADNNAARIAQTRADKATAAAHQSALAENQQALQALIAGNQAAEREREALEGRKRDAAGKLATGGGGSAGRAGGAVGRNLLGSARRRIGLARRETVGAAL